MEVRRRPSRAWGSSISRLIRIVIKTFVAPIYYAFNSPVHDKRLRDISELNMRPLGPIEPSPASIDYFQQMFYFVFPVKPCADTETKSPYVKELEEDNSTPKGDLLLKQDTNPAVQSKQQMDEEILISPESTFDTLTNFLIKFSQISLFKKILLLGGIGLIAKNVVINLAFYPVFRLVFGTLYPAYASYKAVKSKHVKEYVKWMMYWIVFALFTCTETFTDIFLSWFPFYYEIKIILVIWLLSPATKGSSILYRKFVHPMLSSREQEIDEYINKAKEQSYRQVLDLGQKGVTALMQTAIKSGGGIVNQLKKSYSLGDLSDPTNDASDEADDVLVMDPRLVRRRRPGRSPHRSSSASSASVYFSEVDLASRVGAERVTEVRSVEDISSGYSSGEQLFSGNQPLKLQARESISTQRTSSLTRSRSTRVTRSTIPKKASVTSDDSDENEVFDTNIIFLNDQAKKIDKLPESSSSESEFFDIPENNHDLQLHGKVRTISCNNPDSESQVVHNNVGYDAVINVTACPSDNDASPTFSLPLSLNLTKLSMALSSLYSSASNILPTLDSKSNLECNYQKPEVSKALDIIKPTEECLNFSVTPKDDIKPIEPDLSQKISNLKAEFLANPLPIMSNAPLPPKPPTRDQRGGKYNKKHAPLPPSSSNMSANPIKATLVLQPGVLRSLSSSAESLNKEVFVNYSPKVIRRSRNQSPASRGSRSSSDSSSTKTEKPFSKLLRLPKRMAHLGLPGLKKDKRHSWSEFFHGSPLDSTSKRKSRSACSLESISEITDKQDDVSKVVMKRSDSQISIRSLSNSPTAHRRLKVIRRIVDNDID